MRCGYGLLVKLVRETYFIWSEERLASLEALKEQGLSWPQISGRLTVGYDQEVTSEGCRNAWRRLGKRGSLARASGSPSSPGLPQVFARPPPSLIRRALEEPKPEFSWWAMWPLTDEKVEAIWQDYITFQLEEGHATPEEAERARDYPAPPYVRRYTRTLKIWRPSDEPEPEPHGEGE